MRPDDVRAFGRTPLRRCAEGGAIHGRDRAVARPHRGRPLARRARGADTTTARAQGPAQLRQLGPGTGLGVLAAVRAHLLHHHPACHGGPRHRSGSEKDSAAAEVLNRTGLAARWTASVLCPLWMRHAQAGTNTPTLRWSGRRVNPYVARRSVADSSPSEDSRFPDAARAYRSRIERQIEPRHGRRRSERSRREEARRRLDREPAIKRRRRARNDGSPGSHTP